MEENKKLYERLLESEREKVELLKGIREDFNATQVLSIKPGPNRSGFFVSIP
ncbi:hypothetical protein [Pontibacter sp. Tf4]|uniref:hypothetical protein n=1 Tax=Pontibacter sp. Tf4 TaxID=2761620 RepID=UPI001C8AF166|nr:hypothetical protein [Pontibacter sp. Tf4]